MVCRTALVRRRRAGEGARRGAKPKIARAGHKGIPWIAVGSVLGAGSLIGAALFLLLDVPNSGGVHLHSGVAEGCITLTLDRDRGRTETAPCPDATAQVAATYQATLLIPTAY